MKSWDAIIVGAGIIGTSLAISLRKRGWRVLLLDRGEPGQEASHAAAGMLVGSGSEMPPVLATLARESARLYPEFVHELEDESGLKIDLREQGTILVGMHEHPADARQLQREDLKGLEPSLKYEPQKGQVAQFSFLEERSVDPRTLIAAAVKAARHRGVDISSGAEVGALLIEGGVTHGVKTPHTEYHADTVVNCAGAWAGQIAPCKFPVRPVKGQMLSVVEGPAIKHVIRGDRVYLVPRTDGRIVIGSTLEDAGYDKHVDVDTIDGLFNAAVELLPALANSKRHEAWAGLRPGTPDDLPVLGGTEIRGYFVAAGHYRDGILLAPVTAEIMASVVMGETPRFDISPFSASRFNCEQARQSA